MKNHEGSLREALDRFLKNIPQRVKALNVLTQNWAVIAGKEPAKHTKPFTLEEGTLSVKADSPEWGSFIRMETRTLLEIMKKDFKIKADTLRVIFDPMISRPRRQRKKKTSPALAQLDEKEKKAASDAASGGKDRFGYLLVKFIEKNTTERKV